MQGFMVCVPTLFSTISPYYSIVVFSVQKPVAKTHKGFMVECEYYETKTTGRCRSVTQTQR